MGDDAAALALPEGEVLVTSCDVLIEGVHFDFAFCSPRDVAIKSVEVNLSDIAAMGARPRAILCGLAAAPAEMHARGEKLLGHLGAHAAARGAPLIGGDLSRIRKGQLCISITALGSAPEAQLRRRSDARAGQDLWVYGELGLGLAGLRCLQSDPKARAPARPIRVYRRPEAHIEAGVTLGREGLAAAMIDISDGLAQDLGHIARQSGVRLDVETARILLLPSVRRVAGSAEAALRMALTGGDDYALAFTAEPESSRAIERLLPRARRIGAVRSGRGVHLLDAEGRSLQWAQSGHDHFG